MPDATRIALVTGASGFVGSHLVEALLADGWAVRCLVRRSSPRRWLPAAGDVQLAEGDVGDSSPAGLAALAAAVRDATAIFHLAAVTSAARDETYARVNAGGTRRLAEAAFCSAPTARFVLCSSLSAAGPARHGRPVREGDADRPVSAYGRSKLAAERVLHECDVPYVVVRPPAVYGPRDVDILAAFRLARRGLAMRLAPPRQRLSLIHARDLAAALVRVAAPDASGVYYVSDGPAHHWEAVMAHVADAVGRRSRVVPVPGPLLRLAARADRTQARLRGVKPLLTPDRATELTAADWSCDDARIRRELGWAPRIPLAEGMAETAAWYRAEGWL